MELCEFHKISNKESGYGELRRLVEHFHSNFY